MNALAQARLKTHSWRFRRIVGWLVNGGGLAILIGRAVEPFVH